MINLEIATTPAKTSKTKPRRSILRPALRRPRPSALVFKPRNLDRYPRLDTILMVENVIQKGRSDLTVNQIWHQLPKKVLWTTFITILDYLEHSGKILLDKDRTVIWLHNPKLMEHIRKRGVEFV